MGNRHRPLQPRETSHAIQAAIEGLTENQLTTRDEFVRIGFSLEQATKVVRIDLSPNEKNQLRLQEAMRELGWADEQVEIETQKLLDMINDTIDYSLFNQFFSRKGNS
jgi:hypothetical protein